MRCSRPRTRKVNLLLATVSEVTFDGQAAREAGTFARCSNRKARYQQATHDPTIGRLDDMRDVLGVDGLRRLEDAFENLGARVLLADVGEVGAERAAALVADAVAVCALHAAGGEEELAAALDV